MKNAYTTPEIEILEISAETVIAASNSGSFEDYGWDNFKY